VEHLPSEFDTEEEPSLSLKRAVEDFERRHVAFVVRAAGGNRERAARMLEVDPATLYRRLAKYGLH
jgi:DNA-binding NtrC family response regulator